MPPRMIFAPMVGGLGDVLDYYLTGELGHFRALKRAGGVTTAVKLWCINPNAAELFRHHPYVDTVLSEPFDLAAGLTDGFRAWAAKGEKLFRMMTGEERAATPWERPEFYLDPEESIQAAVLEGGAPYVAVHPFAGRPERSLAARGLAEPLITELANAGRGRFRVVVLGGDSIRLLGCRRWDMRERITINHPNVVNLAGRHSIRMHAHVASRAVAFVGAISCFNMVAQAFGIPALCFGSAQNRNDMKRGGSVFAKMRENKTPIYYLDQKPDIPGIARRLCHDLG